jgi:hypothetical protein
MKFLARIDIYVTGVFWNYSRFPRLWTSTILGASLAIVSLFCRYLAARVACHYGPNHQVAAHAVTDKPTYSLIGSAVLNRAYNNLPLRRSTLYSMNQSLQNVQVHNLHFHISQNIKVSVMGCALHERRIAALSMETTATDGNFQDFL